MDRRTFLKTTAGAGALMTTGGIFAPAIAQGAAKTLRFVPQANLANFDPIWGTQYVVRNASVLVWDTLYGFDEKLQPQRQMVESEETSSDGLTWTFKLRSGLKFHDGTPVLAKDCVASLTRWSARDPMGLMLKAIQQELTAVDDRTFKWVLKKPYPKMLLALGKNSTPMAFIMPERIAKTDPFKQIDEYIGSGPMKFAKGEWVPGAKAVFEKFADYQPRQEKASWLAGGKKMLVDRIEWVIMPDPATASAALQNGEVDWWENPISDLVPVLKRNRNVAVDIADPLGNIGTFRMNHLHPPFNDVRARRAVLMALDQEEYMRALVGDDNSLWKPLPGYFTPDTPLYNEEGGDILKGKRDIAGAKKLLAESGYTNQPVTCVVAQDQPITKGQGDVTAELLKRIGMNVDFVATDWGTDRPAPRAEIAARTGRLGHVPLVACGRRLHQSGRLHRDPRQRRRRLVRLAERARGREGSGQLVRRQERSTRRRPPRAVSTRRRSTTSSTRRPASSSAIRRGARMSAASSRARSRSSGA